jgi:PEP-CTERM motif
MKKSILSLVTLFALTLTLAATAQASIITWFTPTDATNSNATFSSINTSYTTNFGVAFKTGPASGGYSLDWVTLGLNSSSYANVGRTVILSLRNATNATAYSAVAGATEYAFDTLSFTTPAANTNFDLNLTTAQIPNITAYTMAANTAYSLVLYSPSAQFGVQRHTGYANGTTNNFYTVSDGFVALDTFRRNTANYTNNTNSYPTLDFSFGAATAPVPEPSTYALFSLGFAGLALWKRRQKKA